MAKELQKIKPKQIVTSFFMAPKALKIIVTNWDIGKLVVFPVILGTAVYGLIFYALYHHAYQWIEKWLPAQEGIGFILYYFVWFFFILIVLLIAAVAYGTFGRLIIAPFSDIISHRTEKYLGLHLNEDYTWKDSLRDIPRQLRVEVLKLLFSLVFFVFLFILTSIPPLAPVGFLASLFGFWILAFEYVDYPLERRKMSFSQRLRWGMGSFLPLTSFGVLLTGMMGIPILGILGLPVGVVGGTLLYHHLESDIKI